MTYFQALVLRLLVAILRKSEPGRNMPLIKQAEAYADAVDSFLEPADGE